MTHALMVTGMKGGAADRGGGCLVPGGERAVHGLWRVAGALCRSACALALPLFGALMLTSCATPGSYAGIPLAPRAAPSELQDLVRRAQAGDKHAQFDLGIRFEEGNGVPIDLKRARRLYARAAADSGGTMWVYSPPVGKHDKGRVVPMNMGPKVTGLEAARERFEVLRND